MGRWQKADKLISLMERAHWVWGLLIPSGASAVTGILGFIGNIPAIWIWVGMVVTFAFMLQAWHRMNTPSGKKKVKIDAVLSVSSETFRMTETFQGDKTPFLLR